jgi:hypothetical protein
LHWLLFRVLVQVPIDSAGENCAEQDEVHVEGSGSRRVFDSWCYLKRYAIDMLSEGLRRGTHPMMRSDETILILLDHVDFFKRHSCSLKLQVLTRARFYHTSFIFT